MAPEPKSPIRHFQKNSPFRKEQTSWVITKFAELGKLTLVRRAFRQKFFPRNPRGVPPLLSFQRLVKRFQETGATRPVVPPGRGPTTTSDKEVHVEKVKSFFNEHPKAHVRQASEQLGMSYGKVWTVLRRNLGWKPYRPHLAPALTPAHQVSRLEACSFWLKHSEDWFESVIWSDEKWFVLTPVPNRKNTVCWAPSNPHRIIPCKIPHGKKVMAWVGIVDGRCLPVHWFKGSVNAEAYLEMLQTVLWPAVMTVATKKQYWFQQDGAPCHVSAAVMAFLRSKFGDRIISRGSAHHWPASSPDLSCLDFSFWSQAHDRVVEAEPRTLQDLKTVVEEFSENMCEADLRKMARHTRRRAELCLAERGGYFEHLL